MDHAERDAFLLLTLTPGLGAVRIRRCIEQFGSAGATTTASATQLASVEGIGKGSADAIRRAMDGLIADRQPEREWEAVGQAGAKAVVLGEAAYPRLLPHIADPPPVLFVRGELRPDDAVALAVVGSRKCSQYGREQADRISAGCAQAGLVIVSGGAYGIDASAHRAALRVNGRTIAVLGSGLARPYPEDHIALFDQIAAEGGAVVSELPMTSPPRAENFPSRNRIISGMSLGVVVIEAALRSGALITARLAAEDHGREVMAIPGRVDSATAAGCHKIIREGWATLVTGTRDVLDALGETGRSLTQAVDERAGSAGDAPSLFEATLTESQRKIMGILSEPAGLDIIAARTSLPVPSLQADLAMLEIRGMVSRQAGVYSRRGT